MSFEIHREPLFKRYYAKLLSGACCYTIIFGFLLIFLPLILAYNSSDFWIKENVTYQQPTVQYKYITTVELNGHRGASPVRFVYSTSQAINSLQGDSLRTATLQSAEQDDNRDGRTDRIELALQMPLSAGETITGFTALVYCNIKLTNRVRYLFDAVVAVQHTQGEGMSSLTTDGDVVLRQTWPLMAKGGFRSPYEDVPLYDLAQSGLSANTVSIPAVLEKSRARNLTMRYQSNYAYAMQDFTAESGGITTPRYFNASMILRVPEQAVRYTPELSVVLKNAWIQYIAFFAVVAFLLFRLNSFVFGHQLLTTHAVADIVYEKMD